MNRTESLQKLESVLESFLERVVQLKEDRLHILGGIDRLDDIARGLDTGEDATERIGNWLAEHNRWLGKEVLRPVDRDRIGQILVHIRQQIEPHSDSSVAMAKISSEIDRWGKTIAGVDASVERSRVIRLSRGPETAPVPKDADDSIGRFRKTIGHLGKMFSELEGPKDHLLSVLDEALKKADLQRDKEALILSGLIIYTSSKTNTRSSRTYGA